MAYGLKCGYCDKNLTCPPGMTGPNDFDKRYKLADQLGWRYTFGFGEYNNTCPDCIGKDEETTRMWIEPTESLTQ